MRRGRRGGGSKEEVEERVEAKRGEREVVRGGNGEERGGGERWKSRRERRRKWRGERRRCSHTLPTHLVSHRLQVGVQILFEQLLHLDPSNVVVHLRGEVVVGEGGGEGRW